MSQLSLSLDSCLLVHDDQGRYLMATADQNLEAARQIIDQKTRSGASFTSPSEVKDYLKAKLSGYEREVFAVMLMDTKHCLIEYVELFQGTIDQAAVYPREVVKLAMQHNAAAMIISHNHPSGNPERSRADELLTKRLKEALALVDVRVMDHIVVAGNHHIELGIADPQHSSWNGPLAATCRSSTCTTTVPDLSGNEPPAAPVPSAHEHTIKI